MVRSLYSREPLIPYKNPFIHDEYQPWKTDSAKSNISEVEERLSNSKSFSLVWMDI